MIHGTCFKVNQDMRGISSYRIGLYDRYEIINIEPNKLRKGIKSGKLKIDNLIIRKDNSILFEGIKSDINQKLAYLTSDDIRTINCSKNLSFMINKNFNSNAFYEKANLLDANINRLSKHMVTLVTNNNIVVITDLDRICIVDGDLLFYDSDFTSIDLTNLDTQFIRSTELMFEDAKLKRLNISTINTSNVINMQHMFMNAELDNLDISKLDTNNVTSFKQMFMYSEIKHLNLGNLNTSKVKCFEEMFKSMTTQDIDLSHFDFTSATNLKGMFLGLKANTLNLGNFNINAMDASCYNSIFNSCTINKVIINSTNPMLRCIKIHRDSSNIGNIEELTDIFTVY